MTMEMIAAIRKHGRRMLASPLLSARAVCRAIRMKRRCLFFGGFADDDPFYALGLTIRYHEHVSIGCRCSFGGNVVLNAYDRIEIGDDCMFAYGVVVTTATHDYAADVMNKSFVKKPVRIGSNVWIGVNAIILPGITIGSGAVVGAGAVVTKDVPENTIVAGNPAAAIKKRPAGDLPLRQPGV